MRRLALIATLLLFAGAMPAAEVRVFAAASLMDALQEIAVQYERRTGDEVVFNFGGSSVLARQIVRGAPADLFLSADEAKADDLTRRGLIAERKSVLSNSLVVVTAGRAISRDALAGVASLALAEPSHVPAGMYARQYLISRGSWTVLAPKIIPTENVRAALSAVEAGNAEAAIVYRTDALRSKRIRIAYEVGRTDGPRISYPFSLLKNSEQAVAARRFFGFLISKPALRVFARHGFVIQ